MTVNHERKLFEWPEVSVVVSGDATWLIDVGHLYVQEVQRTTDGDTKVILIPSGRRKESDD